MVLNKSLKEYLNDMFRDLTDEDITEMKELVHDFSNKTESEIIEMFEEPSDSNFHFEMVIKSSVDDMFDWIYDGKYDINLIKDMIISNEHVGMTVAESVIYDSPNVTVLSSGKCIFVYE